MWRNRMLVDIPSNNYMYYAAITNKSLEDGTKYLGCTYSGTYDTYTKKCLRSTVPMQ